jgi:leucyl aminopeptidase
MGSDTSWKNLILTIPGSVRPQEEVLLTAHLDSTSSSPATLAPGANDNATGAAALLEAARVLQGRTLPRTLRIIWFTGEEQNMIGSSAYAAEHDLSGVQAVINLDMFGYDGDGDRCFELHVGTLEESAQVAGCYAFAVGAYAPELRFDTLTQSATTSSDHDPFWNKGIGAVEVLENHFNVPSADGFPPGCSGRDPSPHYHRTTDTLANMHPAYAYAIARAGLAAAFGLASPNLVFVPFVQ